jgi:leucyl-tRNA synthetase
MEGMSRWVRKVWRVALNTIDKQLEQSSASIETALQVVIKKVGSDIEKRRYNTAVAAMMTFVNVVTDEIRTGSGLKAPQGLTPLTDENGKLIRSDLKKFLLILAPFAPFITEELWSRLGNKESIHKQSWPNYDESRLVVDRVQIVVQVNGKLRGIIEIDTAQAGDQTIVEKIAKENQSISKYLNGRIKKVIFVPGKLINFVVR